MINATYRHITISNLDGEALAKLSSDMKLSLSREDMLAVQAYFAKADREPTDVELEVIAQTWSEHCKHRIFGAQIEHTTAAGTEVVDGLFKTYIKAITEKIMEQKPGFVLSAFHDNAGFIDLDDDLAICLKAETHNHPSAIEPYAGANTGLGGVIRDILGAGKGAKPVASLDVFCFGSPDTRQEDIKAADVIHPLGVMRGVVRGVRDYGNRMGIPTVSGAIQFDPAYIYNPLVFCGTAGVIPRGDIDKEMEAGLKIIAVGGRTGRDGLHGATFSSASLTTDSHEEDQQAVQIGNPIEEKKVSDFILDARGRGLIVFITDCGAGGFSSAAGEMLSETGGQIYLERAPLKEPGLVSWEIFLSESQERMVLAVREESLDELRELARIYETELTDLGQSDGSGILKVSHNGEMVCELDCAGLHEAPRRHMVSTHKPAPTAATDVPCDPAADLAKVLGDFAIVSREPIIREYDHEVQGNTFLKPLAGAAADAPQDAAVMRVDNSKKLFSMAVSILPEWGKYDPFAMGQACVDECVRQLVLSGANPQRIAILDNFCMGNPDDTDELGALVETVKGMAEVALEYQAPFVSGKDSFYNYFETAEGPVSIPVTLLVSGFGVVEETAHITGSSLRGSDSVLLLLGTTENALGGSVFARIKNVTGQPVPQTNAKANFALYQRYYQAVCKGLVLSAHDLSEGGLAVTAAEMGFTGKHGIHLDLPDDALSLSAYLFSESTGRLLIEVDAENATAAIAHFEGLPCQQIGVASEAHRALRITRAGESIIDEDLSQLKSLWKNGLTAYY
jgi:phosphoribosylformylglycinamidine synthase subunit PurSL